MLDDRVIGRPSVHKRNSVQRDTDANEVEDFIDKGAKRCKKTRKSTQFVIDLTSSPKIDLVVSYIRKVI